MSLHKHLLINALIVGMASMLSQSSNAQLIPGMTLNGIARQNGDTVFVCLGSTINYTSTASGNSSIQWTFFGGRPRTSTSATPSVRYDTVGIYNTVQVVNSSTASGSMSIYVIVSNTHPDSNFVASQNGVCGNEVIQFTASGAGYSHYIWDFGDNTSNVDNSTAYHQFLSAIGSSGTQTFNVRLTVTDIFGCSSSKISPIVIKKIPDASIDTAGPGIIKQLYEGLTSFGVCTISDTAALYPFRFKNTSTTISSNSIYTIKWGDGITSDSTFTTWNSGQTITHYFPYGNSLMTVEIRDLTSNCIGTRQYRVFVGRRVQQISTQFFNSFICEGDSTGFVLNNYLSDPPGSRYYYLVYNQQTGFKLIDTVYFNPFINNQIRFQVNRTSCGQQNNIWTLKIVAENFCGSSTPASTEIVVSKKPRTQILFAPNYEVHCLNSTIRIQNNSDYSNTISGAGIYTCGTLSVPVQAWSIFPSTGFSIVSGDIGSFINGSIRFPGTRQVDLRFTTANTYIIRLYIVSPICGLDSIDRIVCIRDVPDANFTLIQQTSCIPATVALSKSTLQYLCSGDTVAWSFTYSDPLNCRRGLSITPQFLSGSATTFSNIAQFNAPGIYVAKLTVLSKNGDVSCSTSRLDTFTVKGLPTVKINPNSIKTICVGGSINPSATVSYCYTTNNDSLMWLFPGGVYTSLSGTNPGLVVYNDTGYFLIKVYSPSECGTATDSLYVRVVGTPVINAGQDKSVCTGQAANIFLFSSLPQTLFTWVSTVTTGNITGNTNGTNKPDTVIRDVLINLDTTVATVVYHITPSLAGCPGLPVTITVTVIPGAIANAGRDTVLCNGATTTLLNGNRPPYGTSAWHLVKGPAVTIQTADSSSTIISDLIIDSVYLFMYTINNASTLNCPAIDTVKVVSRPEIINPFAGDDLIECDSVFTTYRLKGNNPQPYETGTWIIDSGNTTIRPFPTIPVAQIHNPSATIMGLSPGQVVLIWKINNDGSCTPKTDTIVISLNRSAQANAGADTTICKEELTQLQGMPGGGLWNGPGVTITGSFNPLLTGNGNFILTYSVGSFPCISTDTIILSVTDAPLVYAGADTSVCANLDTFLLHGSPIGGVWSGSPSVTITGVFTPSTIGNHELYYSYGLGSCNRTDTIKVSVGNAILNNTITGSQELCSNTQPNRIIGPAASGGVGVITYRWQESIDSILWNDIPGANGLSYQPPVLTLTTFFRRVAMSTLCPNSAHVSTPVKVVTYIRPISSIVSDSVACVGYPLSFVALVHPVDSIASSVWDLGNGVTLTGSGVSTSYTQPGPYQIRLISRTLRGCSDTAYKTVHVYSSPVVNAGRNARICRDDSLRLNATGASTYTWSPTSSLSCISCATPIAKPLTTTLYTVSGTGAGGCTSVASVLVEVIQRFTLSILPVNPTICIPDTLQLFASASSAVQYSWSPSTGLSSSSAPNPFVYPLATTTYTVTAKDSASCFEVSRNVTVLVGRKPTIDLGIGMPYLVGDTIRMNPVITNGPIRTFLWEPASSFDCSICPNPALIINKDLTVKLSVESIYGCRAESSIKYTVFCNENAQVYIPNAFSPDGDNLNDVFMIRGKGITVRSLRIYNRFGQLVFQQKDNKANIPSSGWDGTIHSKQADPDIYVYAVEILCDAGEVYHKKGNLQLYR